MPAFWMEATLYTLEESEWKKFVDKWQKEVMRTAVKKFLIATLKRIPVRTGFLRGAFYNIRKEFSDKVDDPHLNPILQMLTSAFSARDPESGKMINVDTRALFREAEKDKDKKVSAAGKEARIRQLQREMRKGLKRQNKGKKGARQRLVEYYYKGTGKQAEKIKKTPRSGIQFATDYTKVLKFDDNVATFFLDISISYYRVNDFYSRIKGAPWNSMMEGGSAMANWLGRCADLFPEIGQILARQKIVLRGSRLLQSKLPQEAVAQRLLSITGFHSDVGESDAPPPPAANVTKSGKRQLQMARLMANRQARAKQGEKPKWPFPEQRKQNYGKKGEN